MRGAAPSGGRGREAPPRDGRTTRRLSLVSAAAPDAAHLYGMQRLVCPRLLMALPVGAAAATDKPIFFDAAADEDDCGGATSESDVDVERAGDDDHDADDEDAMDLSRRGLSDDDDGAAPRSAPTASGGGSSSGRLAFSVENILDPTKFTGRALCWKPLGAPDDDLSGSDLGAYLSSLCQKLLRFYVAAN